MRATSSEVRRVILSAVRVPGKGGGKRGMKEPPAENSEGRGQFLLSPRGQFLVSPNKSPISCAWSVWLGAGTARRRRVYPHRSARLSS